MSESERFVMVGDPASPLQITAIFRDWTEAGLERDPRARLVGTLEIRVFASGPPTLYDLHAELIAVKVYEPSPMEAMNAYKPGDTGWQAADPEFAPYLDELPAAIGDSQTTWQAIDIGDRKYVLICTPLAE